MTGATISDKICSAFIDYCSVPIGIADYRHLATWFMNLIRDGKFLDVYYEIKVLYLIFICEQNTDENTLPFDESAGHTECTAGHVYAQNIKDYRRIDAHQMRGFYKVSSKWHALLHLQADQNVSSHSFAKQKRILLRPRDDTATQIGKMKT